MSAFVKFAGPTLAAIAVGLVTVAPAHDPAPAPAGATTTVADSGTISPNSLIWD